jgi:hypothetical protein
MGVERFNRAIAIFFGLVAIALGIATFANAPLSYDGAYFLFRVLDDHQFAAFHGRLINIPLQIPLVAALHFTQDIGILRLAFSAAYASVPLLGLALSWLVCRSRCPSLFIWPAMSVCIAALPGQFSMQSEAIMAATLLWPALLTVLLGATPGGLALVAISSIAAALSHPEAVVVLAFVALVATTSAIARPPSRRVAMGFAFGFAALLLVRALTPLDPYEVKALTADTIVASLNNSVIGWPLVAIVFVMVAALGCVFPARSHGRAYLMVPLGLAGIALVAWAVRPENWTHCANFRMWVAPLSVAFMAGAAAQTLWRQKLTEAQLQGLRLAAMPLIGGTFLLVLSIQSFQWNRVSGRLASELVNSDRGCITDSTSTQETALNAWTTPIYALELQSRTPRTLFFPEEFSCRLFSLNGDALLAQQGFFTYLRHPGHGWFDLEDARSRTRTPANKS